MAKRRDSNHQLIRKSLEFIGMKVFDTAALGDGFPDLVAVRDDGRVYLVEVKSETGRMTEDEVVFILRIVNPAYRVFNNADDVCKLLME